MAGALSLFVISDADNMRSDATAAEQATRSSPFGYYELEKNRSNRMSHEGLHIKGCFAHKLRSLHTNAGRTIYRSL